MSDTSKKPAPENGLASDEMLGGDPSEINAKTDNDRLAGVTPDPRLPVPPTGGSIDKSDEKFEDQS